MKKRTLVKEPSRFFCTYCGHEGIPIVRTTGQQREAGHLKKLYCIHCGETNHVEIRSLGPYQYEDFLLEFKGGNFDKNGQRKMSYRQFKNFLAKEGKLEQLQNDIEIEIMKKELKNE